MGGVTGGVRGAALALCVALAWPPLSMADEAATLDGPALASHLASIEPWLALRRGGPLPELDDRELARLAGGGTVIKQQSMDGTDVLGATVYTITDVEAWRIWLAICDRDHHEEFMPHIREGVCLLDEGHSRLVYQYLALPGVRDRHWVIRTRTNGALWEASGRTLWESWWALEPDAEARIVEYVESGAIEKISAEQAEEALVTPRNDGCWLLAELPDGRCLVAYQDLSELGGRLPAFLVNELGPPGLRSLVEAVTARGRSIERHFGDDRPPPAAPDGSAVEQLPSH